MRFSKWVIEIPKRALSDFTTGKEQSTLLLTKCKNYRDSQKEEMILSKRFELIIKGWVIEIFSCGQNDKLNEISQSSTGDSSKELWAKLTRSRNRGLFLDKRINYENHKGLTKISQKSFEWTSQLKDIEVFSYGQIE